MSELRIIIMVLLPLICSIAITKTNSFICKVKNKKKQEVKETSVVKDLFSNFFCFAFGEIFFFMICQMATGQNPTIKDYKNELMTIVIIFVGYIMILFIYAIIKEKPLYGGHLSLLLFICIIWSLTYGSYLSVSFDIEHAEEPPISYEYNIYRHDVVWSELKKNDDGSYTFYYSEDLSKIKKLDIDDENVKAYPSENDKIYVLEAVHSFMTKKHWQLSESTKYSIYIPYEQIEKMTREEIANCISVN